MGNKGSGAIILDCTVIPFRSSHGRCRTAKLARRRRPWKAGRMAKEEKMGRRQASGCHLEGTYQQRTGDGSGLELASGKFQCVNQWVRATARAMWSQWCASQNARYLLSADE